MIKAKYKNITYYIYPAIRYSKAEALKDVCKQTKKSADSYELKPAALIGQNAQGCDLYEIGTIGGYWSFKHIKR